MPSESYFKNSSGLHRSSFVKCLPTNLSHSQITDFTRLRGKNFDITMYLVSTVEGFEKFIITLEYLSAKKPDSVKLI